MQWWSWHIHVVEYESHDIPDEYEYEKTSNEREKYSNRFFIIDNTHEETIEPLDHIDTERSDTWHELSTQCDLEECYEYKYHHHNYPRRKYSRRDRISSDLPVMDRFTCDSEDVRTCFMTSMRLSYMSCFWSCSEHF